MKQYIRAWEIPRRFEVAIESRCTQSVKYKINGEFEVNDLLEYSNANIETTIGVHVYDNVTKKTHSFGEDRITSSDDILISTFIDEILELEGISKVPYLCSACGFSGLRDDFTVETVDLEGKPCTDYNCPECYHEEETIEGFRRI